MIAGGAGFTPAEAIASCARSASRCSSSTRRRSTASTRTSSSSGAAVGESDEATEITDADARRHEAHRRRRRGRGREGRRQAARLLRDRLHRRDRRDLRARRTGRSWPRWSTLAGVDAITTGDPNTYEIPLEKLIERDPQVIILGVNPFYSPTPTAVAARPGWDVMTAVKDGMIRPGQRHRDHPPRSPARRPGFGHLATGDVARHPDPAGTVGRIGVRSRDARGGPIGRPRRPAPGPPGHRRGRRARGSGARAGRRGRARVGPDRSGRQHRGDPVADLRARPRADLDARDRDDRLGPADAAGADGDARRRRAGRRRCHVPGPDPQPAGRSVRAGHRVRRRARGGHRGRAADQHRRRRVRHGPRPGLRRRPRHGLRRGPARRAAAPAA